jgi:hypothetical protein
MFMASDDGNSERRNLSEGVRVLDPGITGTNRRRFLKAIGGSTAAGFAFSGTAAADDDEEDDDEDDEDDDDEDEDDDDEDEADEEVDKIYLPNSMTITGIDDDEDEDDEEDEEEDDEEDTREMYGVSVTGKVLVIDEDEDEIDGDDLKESVARQPITSEGDVYQYSGDLVSFTDYDTFQVDVDYNDERISINSLDSGTRVDYEFTVAGDLGSTSSTEDEDSISGRTATGTVSDDADIYEFTGLLKRIVIQDVVELERSFSNDHDEKLYRMTSTRGGVENVSMEEVPSDEPLARYRVTYSFNDGTTYEFYKEIYEDLRVKYSDNSGDYWAAATDIGMRSNEDQLARDMGVKTTGGA